LKLARDQSVIMKAARMELSTLQRAVPRDDFNPNQYQNWQRATTSRQLVLSKIISNAQVREEELHFQAGHHNIK